MLAEIPERKTLSLQQAMAEAGVSRRTMYYWMKSGKVEFKYVLRSPRIYADSLGRERWKRDSTNSSDSQRDREPASAKVAKREL